MPSREEYLKWADSVRVFHSESTWGYVLAPEQIEAFGNRVWNEAIEAAANKCDRSYTKFADDYTQGAEDASNLRAEEIRKLKQGETK